MAFVPVSARNAQVRLVNQVLTMAEWRVRGRSPKIDATNFEGNGWAEQLGSVREAEISVKGLWNSDENIHANPPSVIEGVISGALFLYTNGQVSPRFTFPQIYIEEVLVFAKVRDGLKIEFMAFSHGPYTYPGDF